MDFLCRTCKVINAVKVPYLQRVTDSESRPMDLLALPDVFLRGLMKNMDIKDRMRLRLTCRKFESLVAGSHVGYFDNGVIFSYPNRRHNMVMLLFQNLSTVRIQNHSFKNIPLTEKELAQFLCFSNRLFKRIAFREFVFQLSECSPSLLFIRTLVYKFTFKMLIFNVESEMDLENFSKFMADFPRSKYTMILRFLPEIETIKVLHRMELVQISIHTPQIPVDVFFHLLATHKNVCVDRVPIAINEEEWIKKIQIISADASNRKVKFVFVKYSIISTSFVFEPRPTLHIH